MRSLIEQISSSSQAAIVSIAFEELQGVFFMSRFQISKIFLMTSAILAFAASPSLALTFNANADFSIANNPNGAWSYGWSSTLGSNFNLFGGTDSICDGKIDRWLLQPGSLLGLPSVQHNTTATTFNCITVTFPSNELTLHPGASGQYSIVRWVASTTGTYSLSTKFAGADFVGPTTTDVHVLRNGISIFNDLVNGVGAASAKSFATNLLVNAGDTIDFAVGFGNNQNYGFDTTSLAATISSETPTPPASVPEPASTLGLLALGAFGAGLLLKRKQPASGSSLN
jgi:PEP-CTERM motif